MRKFIYKISSFLFVGSLIILISYFFISHKHTFIPNNMYYCNEFNKAFKNGNYDLIAIGNSKLLSSIDGNVLKKELKLSNAILGYSSSDMSISKLTLKSYLDICKIKPKFLLLEVSWFSFNNVRTGFHLIDGNLFLTDPLLFRYFFRYYPKSFNDIKSRTFTQIKYSFIKPKYIDYSSRHNNVKDINTKTYVFNKKNFFKIFPNQKAGINNLLLNDFYDIIKTCEENKIKVILYTAPEDKEYVSMQKDRSKIFDIFYNMSKRPYVTYLNYTVGGNLYKEDYEKWLENSHHLNENTLFTKVLIKDIQTLPSMQKIELNEEKE